MLDFVRESREAEIEEEEEVEEGKKVMFVEIYGFYC